MKVQDEVIRILSCSEDISVLTESENYLHDNLLLEERRVHENDYMSLT